jgi:hypothetical protein
MLGGKVYYDLGWGWGIMNAWFSHNPRWFHVVISSDINASYAIVYSLLRDNIIHDVQSLDLSTLPCCANAIPWAPQLNGPAYNFTIQEAKLIWFVYIASRFYFISKKRRWHIYGLWNLSVSLLGSSFSHVSQKYLELWEEHLFDFLAIHVSFASSHNKLSSFIDNFLTWQRQISFTRVSQWTDETHSSQMRRVEETVVSVCAACNSELRL